MRNASSGGMVPAPLLQHRHRFREKPHLLVLVVFNAHSGSVSLCTTNGNRNRIRSSTDEGSIQRVLLTLLLAAELAGDFLGGALATRFGGVVGAHGHETTLAFGFSGHKSFGVNLRQSLHVKLANGFFVLFGGVNGLQLVFG